MPGFGLENLRGSEVWSPVLEEDVTQGWFGMFEIIFDNPTRVWIVRSLKCWSSKFGKQSQKIVHLLENDCLIFFKTDLVYLDRWDKNKECYTMGKFWTSLIRVSLFSKILLSTLIEYMYYVTFYRKDFKIWHFNFHQNRYIL